MEQTQLEVIRESLKNKAEEDYRKFSSGLLPGTEGILGVRLPVIRKLARQYAACGRRSAGHKAENHVSENGMEPENGYLGAQELLDQLEAAYREGRVFLFEERLFWGILIGYASLSKEERVKRLNAFLPLIDNWSVCDSCCITYKFMREDRVFWWNYLIGLFAAKEAFTVRFAIVCGLDFFIEENYVDTFLEILAGLKQDAYYVQMAQAWALSMCYVAFPERVKAVFTSGRLGDLVQNKTIQKIRESRQVSGEEKEALLSYRRA